MTHQRLLLLSNSKTEGLGYLDHAEAVLRDFLGDQVQTVVFVPFAGVRISYAEYTRLVRDRFGQMGYQIVSLHEVGDPIQAVTEAQAIAVGGGNTFHLLQSLYAVTVLDAIRQRVAGGLPYIGWSAGSNIACPTIKTTNDMPIIEPPSFTALGVVPFQINPHYIDVHPDGHQGETREERITEFLAVNPSVTVVGLREGTWLRREGAQLELGGSKPARIFRHGVSPVEQSPGTDLNFLIDG